MTLEDFRRECGWSQSELARQAGIDFNTLKRAMNGESISGRTAISIAEALTRGTGRKVHFRDIEGLNVNL